MRYRDPKRLRIISGASVLLILTGVPVIIGLTRWFPDPAGEPPGMMTVYTSGLSSLGLTSLVATVLAGLYGLWLFINQRRDVGRKYLMASSRRRRYLVEDARFFAIVFGVSGLIIGSLAGLYAAMLHARPDLAQRLDLPFIPAELAIGSLLLGGLLYAAGRFNR
jgi:hypothetical protein